VSLSLLYDCSGAAVALVAGCSWELAAIRRGVGKTAAHAVRIIAWVMVGVSLGAIVREIPRGSQFVPAGWILIIQFVPLAVGFIILVVTFRAAGYSRRTQDALAARGRHARQDPPGP
jgi:protein-S-isoprenylcysteine O-methyltransferase Ste14